MRGLYVITPSTITDPELMYRQVHEAIQGGAVLVQFRHKGADAACHKRLAESVLTACQQNRTPAIMNDSIQQAQLLGFDGVHLGQTDGPSKRHVNSSVQTPSSGGPVTTPPS